MIIFFSQKNSLIWKITRLSSAMHNPRIIFRKNLYLLLIHWIIYHSLNKISKYIRCNQNKPQISPKYINYAKHFLSLEHFFTKKLFHMKRTSLNSTETISSLHNPRILFTKKVYVLFISWIKQKLSKHIRKNKANNNFAENTRIIYIYIKTSHPFFPLNFVIEIFQGNLHQNL